MVTENLNTPSCIRTVSGQYVDVFNPNPDTILIEDIAHALSNMPRFGGHLPEFYSVAQHSIRCMDMAPEGLELALLMHDAAEAYLIDVPRPIKRHLTNYKEVEERLMAVIAGKFGFTLDHPLIKDIDEYVLYEEWNGLMLKKEHHFHFPHLGAPASHVKECFTNLFHQYA